MVNSRFCSAVAKEIVVLSKSVTPSRITSNLSGAIRALETLTKADLERLDGLAAAGKQKRFDVPLFALGFVFAYEKLIMACSLTDLSHHLGVSISCQLLSSSVTYDCALSYPAIELGFDNWPKLP